GSLARAHARELHADVVVPAIGDVALGPEESAERRVVEPRLTTAAFDVTAAHVHRNDVGISQVRRARVRVDRRARSLSRSTATDRRRLLRRQERVITIDRAEIEEAAAGRDLRDG